MRLRCDITLSMYTNTIVIDIKRLHGSSVFAVFSSRWPNRRRDLFKLHSIAMLRITISGSCELLKSTNLKQFARLYTSEFTPRCNLIRVTRCTATVLTRHRSPGLQALRNLA